MRFSQIVSPKKGNTYVFYVAVQRLMTLRVINLRVSTCRVSGYVIHGREMQLHGEPTGTGRSAIALLRVEILRTCQNAGITCVGSSVQVITTTIGRARVLVFAPFVAKTAL